MYVNRIDTVRKTVAIAMVVCTIGLIVCGRRDDYYSLTLQSDPGMWRSGVWAFGAGLAGCLVATLGLVVEYLASPSATTTLALRRLFLRLFIIAGVLAIVSVLMTIYFGLAEGIGAVSGTILLLAAFREHRIKRIILSLLAFVAIGLTVLSTQSSYQYARRNAKEIITAGGKFIDNWPRTDAGQEVKISDRRVPKAFRNLGAHRIWVDEEFVCLYVPGHLGLSDREFIVGRVPNPTVVRDSIWIKRPSDKYSLIKIADRLWMTDY